jgi:hypothetical protein
MNKNIYQSFEPVSYNTLEVDINSITINNPYIDIVGQKIVSIVDFNITNSNNKTEIIKSKSALISDPIKYNTIFDINALFNKLETYFNIKPTISARPKDCEFIYNPRDYQPKQ